jgi:folate-dependent tRNA-U54 methylase TrmFO/GidA
MVTDREGLGEKITDWITNHPNCEVRDAVVTQSSDEAFHCIAITLFYWEDAESAKK